MKRYIFGIWLVIVSLFVGSNVVFAQEAETAEIAPESLSGESEMIDLYFFGRDDCKFCKSEKAFVDEEILLPDTDVRFTYFNIFEGDKSKALFDEITTANGLSKITPLTLVGGQIIQGFDVPETTGVQIQKALERARAGENYPIEQYLNIGEVIKSGSGCSDDPDATVCEVEEEKFQFKLPFLGVVELRDFSLTALALVLGVVDGFNPCAMWVLITFLFILMQIGDRKKMFYVAGLFMLAEAVMYYLILVVWYKTWDFVGLDAVVTPAIGILALGSGLYFLYKYHKSKKNLTCDVTDIEYQNGIEKKIKKLVSSPITIATTFGIIGIALSVNIIEFACSIGIPQAFTKILDMNMLDFWGRQGYLFLYIVAYMVDDVIVFGLALWGIDKLHGSYKYSRLSMLIGGVLMAILGVIMLAMPDILVF